MARFVCVKPCPPTELPKIQIPFMATAMKAQGDLSLRGGCDGCELIGNFLIQINPLLAGLGLPLCLLGCLSSVIGFVTVFADIEELLGPPPALGAIIEAVAQVLEKCGCVIAMALPPPAGPICDFLKMVRDIINVFAMIVTCLVGLITHLASFSIKASVMLLSPVPQVRATGLCLQSQGRGMTDQLMSKMGTLGDLMSLVEPIFSLLSSVVPPPFNDVVQDFKDGFAIFNGGMSIGAPAADIIEALQTFEEVVQTTAMAFTTIVSICPE